MDLAELRLIAALGTKAPLRPARVAQAMPVADVHHPNVHVQLAVRCCRACIIVRLLNAGLMQTTLVADVHHAIVGMLFAVRRRLDAIDVIGCPPRA